MQLRLAPEDDARRAACCLAWRAEIEGVQAELIAGWASALLYVHGSEFVPSLWVLNSFRDEFGASNWWAVIWWSPGDTVRIVPSGRPSPAPSSLAGA